MRGISISTEHSLEYFHAQCLLYLADLMFMMQDVEKSRQLVKQASQFVQMNGHPADKGYLHLVIAKTHENNEDTIAELEQAIEEYTTIQDLEQIETCLLLQAKVYHNLGNTQLRDATSEKCLRVRTLRQERSKAQPPQEELPENQIEWVIEQSKLLHKVI